MKRVLRWRRSSGRGVAAIEFAVTLPILMLFVGAVVDFGIALYAQSCLSSIVATGAAYATAADQSTGSVTWANIEAAMEGAAQQALPHFTVNYIPPSDSTGAHSPPDPTQCYCLTGSSPSSTLTSATCGSSCSTGGTAGKFVHVYASTTYTPMLPAYSMLTGNQTLSASMWVPLQ